MLPTSFWTKGVSPFLDGVIFMYNTNPSDQAKCTKSIPWKKRYDGLDLQDTSDRKKTASGERMRSFWTAIVLGHTLILYELFEARLTGEHLVNLSDNKRNCTRRNRSSRPVVLFKKDLLKSFLKLTRKHLC